VGITRAAVVVVFIMAGLQVLAVLVAVEQALHRVQDKALQERQIRVAAVVALVVTMVVLMAATVDQELLS
jgi:Co/Zn/Cd efflux system component